MNVSISRFNEVSLKEREQALFPTFLHFALNKDVVAGALDAIVYYENKVPSLGIVEV